MNLDKYNEVINGKSTYEKIAKVLVDEEKGKAIIGWTDQEFDHRDILFTYQPHHLGGELQRGLRWCYLYVSIMDHACMGFLIEMHRDNRKDNGYLMEKLHLHENHCDIAICELINGVIHEIDRLEQNYVDTTN